MAAKKRKRKSSAGSKRAGKRTAKKKVSKKRASKKKAAKKKPGKKKAAKKKKGSKRKLGKKRATRKPIAKKKAAKKKLAKKKPAKKTAAKKTAAKKTAAKKTAAKKTAAKKTAAKKKPAKKTVSKKKAAKKQVLTKKVENEGASKKKATNKTKKKVAEATNDTPSIEAKPEVEKSAAATSVPDSSEREVQSTLSEGQAAPSFELTDQTGARVSDEALSGKPYVLYFYPKDNTPGCTTEACDFRDRNAEFEKLGVKVIGVSPDSERSHVGFADKFNLNFSLLADGEKELAKKFGAWVLKKNYGREYMGVQRSTFLVGADGVIKKAWRGVKVPGHVEAVLEAASSESEP